VLLALWLLWGNRAALVVLVMFLSASSGLIAIELFRRAPLPCGCFGAAIDPSDVAAVKRSLTLSLATNMLMLAACGWLFVRRGGAAHDAEGSR
jgi:hypothetical protein